MEEVCYWKKLELGHSVRSHINTFALPCNHQFRRERRKKLAKKIAERTVPTALLLLGARPVCQRYQVPVAKTHTTEMDEVYWMNLLKHEHTQYGLPLHSIVCQRCQVPVATHTSQRWMKVTG